MRDRQIEKLIYYGAKTIPIKKEDFNNLKEETKELIKISRIKIELME